MLWNYTGAFLFSYTQRLQRFQQNMKILTPGTLQNRSSEIQMEEKIQYNIIWHKQGIFCHHYGMKLFIKMHTCFSMSRNVKMCFKTVSVAYNFPGGRVDSWKIYVRIICETSGIFGNLPLMLNRFQEICWTSVISVRLPENVYNLRKMGTTYGKWVQLLENLEV